ncbi:MAG: hypothetical protein JO112_16790, partial [Planctomycetes bacterium]|nr:hypothetical protein [Planctomycetota bacterium]
MVWSPARAQEAPRDDPFPAQVQKLTPGHAREIRLEALDWMLHSGYRPKSDQALRAVEHCVKQDPDPEVRAKAVEVLGMTAYQHQPRVCPLAVLEALLDPDADVRNIAMGCSGMYREFAPGAREVLLKATRHEAPGVRSHALLLLAEIAPRDAGVVQIIRAAQNDKDFDVRCDAHFALFRITGKLEDVVPYYLRMTAECRAEPSPRTEAEKEERTRKVLRCLGALNLLSDLGEKRPDELAKFLLEMLKDQS